MSSKTPNSRSEIQDIKAILAELERILSADDTELGAADVKSASPPKPEEERPDPLFFDADRSLRSEVALLGDSKVDNTPTHPHSETGERTIQMSSTARNRALDAVTEIKLEPDAAVIEQLDALPEGPVQSATQEEVEAEASFLPDLNAEPAQPEPEGEPEEARLDVALDLLSSLPEVEDDQPNLDAVIPETHEFEAKRADLEPLDLADHLEEGSPSNLEPLDVREPQEEGSMSDQDIPKNPDDVLDDDILDLATLMDDIVEDEKPSQATATGAAAPEMALDLAGPGGGDDEGPILELDLALPDVDDGLLEAVQEDELDELEADVQEAQSPIASADDFKEFESAYLDALLLNDDDFDLALQESAPMAGQEGDAQADGSDEPAAQVEDEEIPMPDISDIDLGVVGEPMEHPRKLDPDVDFGGPFAEEVEAITPLPDLEEEFLFSEEEANPDADGTGNFGDTLVTMGGGEAKSDEPEVVEPSQSVAPAWQAAPLAAAAETAVVGAAAAAGQAAVEPVAQATGIDAAQLAALLSPMIEKVVRDTVLEVAERVIREEMGKLREALDADPDA
ncbi:MAG: hypothetical protein COX57_04985 [Alphaproteobacteria bacterium CG_4_10_14_0_2_um_filter_63_37]|nr:MAG: hypothetical protein AUJ55_01870 [Proteobacteria bacterium CG1_02_64_396]PJA25124.1 MAG: hypothetical protein COX57_04985 [Alphaproteobacteria bacterium CG_4_10_14_0_2_um_filter_63_37]